MRQVFVAGNPNAGKTTLFNRLAGTRARTGNYPGVTVDRRTARITLPGASSEAGEDIELVDIPGTYSLSARSPEEQIAATAILEAPADATAIVVVDACALGRGLYLVHQVLEADIPAVIALNMMDEARATQVEVDVEGLAKALGVSVVPIVASTGEGLDALRTALAAPTRAKAPSVALDTPLEEAVGHLAGAFPFAPSSDENEQTDATLSEGRRRAWAQWALLSLGDGDEVVVPEALRQEAIAQRQKLEEAGVDVDEVLVGARYAITDRLYQRFVREDGKAVPWSERVDRVLTHPVGGLLVFSAVMLVVFESLFAWSDPMIGLIEGAVGWAQDLSREFIPAGVFQDLVAEGVVAGVGNVVVFVPQIGLLFLLIALLEDSGYLARVAFVIDRLMRAVGLHGKAFVPLLSGFACAIPAVMATRTIADRKDRLVTMLALPLMSCSARLPVYVLVTAAVFAPDAQVGFLSLGAVVLFSMYALSVLATLAAAALMRRTVLKGPRPTLVLELPPYRRPLGVNVVSATLRRVKSFLVDAGTVILALTIVLWALLSFPKSDTITAEAETAREAVAVAFDGQLDSEEAEARLSAIDATEASRQLEYSYAGRLGKAIEPALEPLGMDWRIGIGVIGAFAAREVFVSTLGVVFGIGETDEESEPLRESLRQAERPDGTPLMTPLAGIALMVFFVLACQCMSTIAVVKRESGGWRWPLFMVAYMTVLAYGATLLVFQVGTALGWGTG